VIDIDIEVRRAERRIALSLAAEGGLTALFGPSGAGKTSLLDAVAGLVTPERGHIAIGDAVLFDSASGINLPPEQRGCGYVFQESRLFPHLTVAGNLMFGTNRADQGYRWLEPAEAIEFLGISHLLDRRPATLSGGEAQRVAIGRALLSNPRILLLDEPLSFLDASRRNEVMQVIERIRDELALPILYVTHDRVEVERLADRVVDIA